MALKTVLITMHCRNHNTYSFEVRYDAGHNEPGERDDSVLMRRIAHGIVDNTQPGKPADAPIGIPIGEQ